MPNFESLVKDKLEQWHHHQRKDVIKELAGHLEDRYEELLREAIAPREALRAALSEVEDWEQLWRAIESTRREAMTDRAKRVWIPGIIALLISISGAMLAGPVLFVGTHPTSMWLWLALRVPYLSVSLVAGAAGAAYSLFSGGSRRQRVWAAEFPAVCALTLVAVQFPWGLMLHNLELLLKHSTGWQGFRGLTFGYLVPVLIHASVLLIGASPFLASEWHGLEGVTS